MDSSSHGAERRFQSRQFDTLITDKQRAVADLCVRSADGLNYKTRKHPHHELRYITIRRCAWQRHGSHARDTRPTRGSVLYGTRLDRKTSIGYIWRFEDTVIERREWIEIVPSLAHLALPTSPFIPRVCTQNSEYHEKNGDNLTAKMTEVYCAKMRVKSIRNLASFAQKLSTMLKRK